MTDQTQPLPAIPWKGLLGEFEALLSPNDAAFGRRVYSTGPEVYQTRLEAIGFTGLGRVLDAGCGFGQWTLQLARLNGQAVGVDVSSIRLVFLRELAQRCRLSNLHAQYARLERLPFEDGAFDAVFCYGAIFATGWRQSLQEFCRVLRPGGLLYVTANGVGWCLQLWLHGPHAAEDYHPQENAAMSLVNSIDYECFGKPPSVGPVIIEKLELLSTLESLGLQVVAEGAEGTLRLKDNAEPPQPFFQSEYCGHEGVYEVIARKR